jgi:hypothetical protein
MHYLTMAAVEFLIPWSLHNSGSSCYNMNKLEEGEKERNKREVSNKGVGTRPQDDLLPSRMSSFCPAGQLMPF